MDNVFPLKKRRNNSPSTPLKGYSHRKSLVKETKPSKKPIKVLDLDENKRIEEEIK